jgi:hypothetical protein
VGIADLGQQLCLGARRLGAHQRLQFQQLDQRPVWI